MYKNKGKLSIGAKLFTNTERENRVKIQSDRKTDKNYSEVKVLSSSLLSFLWMLKRLRPCEWLTESISNINKYSIETFFLHKESSITVIKINKANKKTLMSEWLSQGQTNSQRSFAFKNITFLKYLIIIISRISYLYSCLWS